MLVVELVIHDTIGLAVPDREVHLVDADSPNAAFSASCQPLPLTTAELACTDNAACLGFER